VKNLTILRNSLLFIFTLSTSVTSAQTTLEKQWLTDGLKVPESVLIYKNGKANFLFVAQIDGDPSAMDGNGGIAKMSMAGALEEPNWVSGLNAPKGMAIFDGKLYVADINQLVVIDIKAAKVEQKIAIPDAIFLNDVAADAKGSIYISDTKANKVFRYQNGAIEEYLNNIENANGLKTIASNLVVGAGTHLLLFDASKNQLEVASGFAKAIDGVESFNRGEFLVSCWPGLIYYVHFDGKAELVLDTQQEKINSADIAYDSATKTLFVPNFSNNSVTAYKVNTP